MPTNTDLQLLEALTKAYTARAKLFHSRIEASQLDLLIAEIDAIDGDSLAWDDPGLGVSTRALECVQQAGGLPHQVFAHPDVVKGRPYLIAYYRNVVTLSQKGVQQILFSVDKYESRRVGQMTDNDATELCRVFNRILSNVIEEVSGYTVQLSRNAALAEIGAQIQGSWVNIMGRNASREVERVFESYIADNSLGTHLERGHFRLNNNWDIRFGTEPDVAFVDTHGETRIAIEIKGSLDKAGAQTRYGEAKKSFAKELSNNPRCHTIYLASCFTEAVIRQIQADGQVRDWFNLTSVLYDAHERKRFLDKLFHIVQTPH